MADDDDLPVLSDFAAAALAEFYEEQKLREEQDQQQGADTMPTEDWQLSQFWYTDKSSERLAREALAVMGDTGRVACLCCPSIHQKLVSLGAGDRSVVLEVDRRFSHKFGHQYVYYDYKEPLSLAADLEYAFDLVIADPPFLNEECLSKAAQTVQFLTKGKVMLCTGERMGELAKKYLSVTPCSFIPEHHQLQNEFRCYTNYDVITLER